MLTECQLRLENLQKIQELDQCVDLGFLQEDKSLCLNKARFQHSIMVTSGRLSLDHKRNRKQVNPSRG